MSSQEHFYITTTLPYVNDKPHIGFALEIIQADMLARYKALSGAEVFFTTGTDEHGSKIYDKAVSEGKDVQDYVDFYAEKFKELKGLLGLYDDLKFIRTTDKRHVEAAQEFWNRCLAKGDIYKKAYQTKYCSGCELEKTDSELVEGKCPLHPNKDLVLIDEENYFFKYSNYEKQLLEFFNSTPDFVFPDFRFNEIKRFVESGLQDFSISRLKTKMPWGIPVPGDDDQVMYVWFDALINYISTLGWPNNDAQFKAFWPGLQVAGKDQVRMQAGMWQAMLMSAGLPQSKQIFLHGFINVNGQKMSKSIGNVVSPVDLVERYGIEAVRYYLLREIHPYEDSDFTIERFEEMYTSQLSNGLGNLVSRTLKMAVSYEVPFDGVTDNGDELFDALAAPLKTFDFKSALDLVWAEVSAMDLFIQQTEPFKKVKVDPEAAKKDIQHVLAKLYKIARALRPALPKTAAAIEACITEKKMPEAGLFPRLEPKA